MLIDLNNRLVNTNLITGLTLCDATPKNPDSNGRVAPYIIIKQLGIQQDHDITFSSIDKWEKACNTFMSLLKEHGDFVELTLEK